MGYSVDKGYEIGLEMLDKKGSDFVQLPEFLNAFEAATYDFIGDRIPVIEKTQQITEDMRPLMKTIKQTIVQDPIDTYAVMASIPSDTHYLFRVNPIFTGNVSGRRPKLIRHGNLDSFNSDPFQKPSIEYPLITEEQDMVRINSGYIEKAIACWMTYLKKPTLGTISNTTADIVNLSEEVTIDIINKTVLRLMTSRADDRYQIMERQEKTFRHGVR